MIERADFAVIGGGPAGASAARRLAAAGASVLLFERRPMPRPKPCGGAISARGLAALGFPLPDSLIDGQAFGIRAHVGEQSVEARLDVPIAVLVTRARFDQFLVTKAEEAGARVVWQLVRSVDVRPDGVVLTTPAGELAAACAVVCEGATARLARAVAPPPAWHRLFCVTADVPACARDGRDDADGVLDVYHGGGGWGYGWVFHHGSYRSVGIAGSLSKMGGPRETFRQFVTQRGLALDGVRVRGHFIPCGGVRRRRVADRLLLAGDAAGLADPFTGEGVAQAIRSGQLAADVALEAAARRDFSAASLAAYDRLCYEAFDRDLRRARRLTRAMSRWPSPMLSGVASGADVLQQYLRIQTGEGTYRAFLRWFLPRALWRWAHGETKRPGCAPR